MASTNGKTVLVTGGAGYIGSHCVVTLQEAGYEVIALDNFANSVDDGYDGSLALKRVEKITGTPVKFYKCDLLDTVQLEKIFENHKIDSVIHFAAMKAVGESMQYPMLYYKNNIIGMINLLEIMKKYNIYNLVFSSSCTVYGEPEELPITEEKRIGQSITNVYGRTKFFIEEILKDVTHSEDKWNIIALRYFNPVGAHESGLIGEDPTKQFTNLMPFISQVAAGKKDSLTIFGNDYDTPDGTGIRDYIHVMDLATGHVAALHKLEKSHIKIKAYNLGTGRGVSVLNLINTFEKTNNVSVPYTFEARRAGDISTMYADPSLAERELGWKANRSLEQMCSDFWRWQKMNPVGYKTVLTNGHSH
ncbi:UDP-glucose 4-epimerase-like [Sitodiplosis mosellana]|uniref:UDP-glucose 4-epimerase-like n=1 Tax=Sitodiplosis mosellana TaxID=263140 RepID=UPI0024450E1C|nr:UDP-glucose 4-epimerase-like [Sitodiplosis mosellana]XP_055321059.1 UDP-glucose 4-epimerase-like [Sitodiplosis mosellana]XP_055321060.1 UDP-glucose 4-epimerase-like [Sitodiplosis mosellana]